MKVATIGLMVSTFSLARASLFEDFEDFSLAEDWEDLEEGRNLQ